ncbi:TonB-dependent receptor [Erythrobacter rubeus]|uniref:TonB-dependent receptor n=1 Tax=Erythrobacter rubeus TaxID=2760803 RepID=A0ABR8KUI7_9SPHN|nr:TonB-dependent receptor [Erythrobacter rubeus]MBD2842733.1 TonB-dependent receptor [Erythrobacter rubeus]
MSSHLKPISVSKWALLAPFFLPSAVWAQEAEETETDEASAGLDVILVTATKDVEDAQDVPISLSVVDSESLTLFRGGGDDTLFLSGRVPSLNIETSFGRIFPRPGIRGLNNTDFDFNASQPVSYVYDEVVWENPVLKGFPVFDLARVEVLRGPQGTLFGRNTPAGVLKFESAKPEDDFDAYATASYGRFDTVQLEGAVNIPINDVASLRLSAIYQERDDFIENVIDDDPRADAGGYEDFAYRAQLLLKPTDNFAWLINAHGRHLTDGQTSFQANAFLPGSNDPRPGFDRTVTFADAQRFSVLDTDTFGITSRADWNIGGVDLTYIFGWETAEAFSRGDVDGGFGAAFLPTGGGPGLIPFPAESGDGIDDLDQITHEVRITNADAERLNWTAGFYYFDEDLDISSFSFDTLAGGIENGSAFQSQDTTSWAVFGAVDYELTDRLTFAGGVRYTDDDRNFVAERVVGTFGAPPAGPSTRDVGDDEISFDLALTYELSEDVNVFAKIARGFRAPSIQGRILFAPITPTFDGITVADTETIISYEAGLKSNFLDGRGRFNLTGYVYSIDDQQLTAIGGAGNFNQLVNIDQGLGYGIEAELDFALTDALTLSSNFSWNETEIKDETAQTAPCGSATPCTVLDPIDRATGNALIDGNPFPQSPRFIANAVLQYNRQIGPGEFFATTDWSYRSSSNIFLYDSVEFEAEPQVLGGLRVGYQLDSWTIAGWARNITNTVGTVSAIDFNNLSGIFNQPRTYGVEIGWRY